MLLRFSCRTRAYQGTATDQSAQISCPPCAPGKFALTGQTACSALFGNLHLTQPWLLFQPTAQLARISKLKAARSASTAALAPSDQTKKRPHAGERFHLASNTALIAPLCRSLCTSGQFSSQPMSSQCSGCAAGRYQDLPGQCEQLCCWNQILTRCFHFSLSVVQACAVWSFLCGRRITANALPCSHNRADKRHVNLPDLRQCVLAP